MANTNIIELIFILTAGLIFTSFLAIKELPENFTAKNEETTNLYQSTTISIQGNHESTIGVMDELSCYCYNGGYLTINSDQKIPFCIENNENKIKCEKGVTINGNYKIKSINPEKTNPCKAGKLEYFNVESYSCN